MSSLAAFKDVIARRCGLVFAGPAEATLDEAISRRIAATRVRSRAEYFTMLLGDEGEFQELVALLTINETYFFREPDQFSLLTDRLIPRLLARKQGGLPLRILSAGCSTGEEPYSIAIALLEKFGDSAAGLCSVLACDIDRQVLERARTATYHAYSFRGVPEATRQRWFRATGNDLVVDPRAQALVSFHHANLLEPDFSPELDRLDVVFFRNVSIYFDTETRRTIQSHLRRRLNDPGFLVVGGTETLANDFGLLALEEDCGRFYFAHSKNTVTPGPGPGLRAATPQLGLGDGVGTAAWLPAPGLGMTPAAPVPAAPIIVSPLVLAPTPAPRIEDIREMLRANRHGEAAAALALLRAAAGEDVGVLLLDGWRLLQQHALDEAQAAAEAVLRQDAWSVDAHALLGFAARRRNDSDEALSRFKQAAYVRYDCWPLHYYLGELHRAGGRLEPSRRAYRLALQQLTGRPDPDGGLLLPLDLPLADVRMLCAHHAGGAVAAPGS